MVCMHLTIFVGSEGLGTCPPPARIVVDMTWGIKALYKVQNINNIMY